jgi:hypothetical protein
MPSDSEGNSSGAYDHGLPGNGICSWLPLSSFNSRKRHLTGTHLPEHKRSTLINPCSTEDAD